MIKEAIALEKEAADNAAAEWADIYDEEK